MIDNKFEALSALIDGECDNPAELLVQVGADPELRARWREHYRSRAAMHGTYSHALGDDFASRVSAELEKEPSILAPGIARPAPGVKSLRWQKPALGLAIAATVAAVSVFGLNNLSTVPESSSGQIASTASGDGNLQHARDWPVSPSVKVRRVSLDSGGTHWQSQRVEQRRDPAVEKRLNVYLADHMEYATSSKVLGMLPYSRLVGYDTKQ